MRETLGQFIAEHDGKEVSGWSNSGGQCVDLVRRYIQQVLGATTRTFDWIAAGNAHDFYANANSNHFRRVHNTPTYIPRPGTICVLNHGYFGHVFIVTNSDVHLMRCFEQNWAISRRCSRGAHGFVEIIGFLEPLILYPKAA